MAIDLIGRAIAVNPYVAEYHNTLGDACRRSGQRGGAIASFCRAIELNPELSAAYSNLGHTLKSMGRSHEAIAAYYRVVTLEPSNFDVQRNLGVALTGAGRLDEAITALRRAVQLVPGSALAHINLGFALSAAGRLEEATLANRRAIALEPDNSVAHNNLGGVLNDLGEYEEAIAAYRRSIELRPDAAVVHTNLGNALWNWGWLDEAISSAARAIALDSGHVEAHVGIGNAFVAEGRLDEALASFRKSVEMRPDLLEAASSLLFALHYHPDYGAQALLAEHRRWARQHAEPLAAQIRPHGNDRTPDRRLRIGFLSPDLRGHPVGRSLLPLFAHLDPRQSEIVCYSDVRGPDDVTERLKALTHEWHKSVGLRDPELADRIRGDAIDILVDTTLHTARNRLLVFARKPAPVQVTMLGPPATSGLTTMDYRLTDPYLDPPGSCDIDYTERSVRLPHCFWIFQPPDESPPVESLPAGKNGFITFGCLNQFAKVTRPTLELWVKILQAFPDSRLVIQSEQGGHIASGAVAVSAGRHR